MSKLSQGIKKSVALALATATILPLTQVSFNAMTGTELWNNIRQELVANGVPLRREELFFGVGQKEWRPLCLPDEDDCASSELPAGLIDSVDKVTEETLSKIKFGTGCEDGSADRDAVILTRMAAASNPNMLNSPDDAENSLKQASNEGRVITVSLGNVGSSPRANFVGWRRLFNVSECLPCGYLPSFTPSSRVANIICSSKGEASILKCLIGAEVRVMLSNTFCFLRS